jgi:dihydrofolate synthase/folylpolyglutamate synthase
MALAAMAAACALPGLTSVNVVRGLAAAALPARFELVRTNPPVVLDGAHTPESVRLTVDTARTLFPGPKVLLFACAYDKRHAEIASILAPHFEAIIITKPGTFKASDPKAVFASFAALRPDARLEEDTAAALARAAGEADARGAALLVTGSFYLCAEAKTFFS